MRRRPRAQRFSGRRRPALDPGFDLRAEPADRAAGPCADWRLRLLRERLWRSQAALGRSSIQAWISVRRQPTARLPAPPRRIGAGKSPLLTRRQSVVRPRPVATSTSAVRRIWDSTAAAFGSVALRGAPWGCRWSDAPMLEPSAGAVVELTRTRHGGARVEEGPHDSVCVSAAATAADVDIGHWSFRGRGAPAVTRNRRLEQAPWTTAAPGGLSSSSQAGSPTRRS